MERGGAGAGEGGQSGTGRRRVSVAEAAEVLGTTVEGVRGRIKRGTLEVEREGERVFVLLPADQSTDRARPADDQPGLAAVRNR